MFTKGVEIISESIFPIFKVCKFNNQTGIAVVGTGFFIDNNGNFLTASHVIENTATETCKYWYFGNLPSPVITNPIDIEEIKRDNIQDLFLGKIAKEFHKPVKIAKTSPPIGKSLCLCGYPMPEIRLIAPNKINVDNVRVYYQPSFVLDGFRGVINVNGIERKYEAFMTRDASLPGMSGGPVFDVNGIVYGMDVACFYRGSRGSNPMRIDNGISIRCEKLLEFIK